jgi:glutathione S-transferase
VAGKDYLEINPKGKVPALETGQAIITETQVILQYLSGMDALQPAVRREVADWHLLETLNFIATELHKAFSPLWLSSLKRGVAREEQVGVLKRNFQIFEQLLGENNYLMGERFSVADAYAYTVLRWCEMHAISLVDFKLIRNYLERLSELPAVRRALAEQRLS